MGVPSGKQTITELEHLAFHTGSGERIGTGLEMVVRFRCSIPSSESGEGEESLEDRSHVTAVSQVFQTGETFAKYRFEFFAVIADHGKIEFQIVFELEFSHGFFSFGLTHYFNAEY